MKVNKIVIHHSATTDTSSISWSAIRNHHTSVKGWEDIGYHAGCELIGGKYECLYGRPATNSGAHTIGINSSSLGFCFVGNYNHSRPSGDMLRIAAERVIAPWVKLHGLSIADIVPHRDYKETDCPGRLFDINKLRAYVDGCL